MPSPSPRQIHPLPTPDSGALNFFSLGSFSPVSLAGALLLVLHFGGLPHGGSEQLPPYLQKAHYRFPSPSSFLLPYGVYISKASYGRFLFQFKLSMSKTELISVFKYFSLLLSLKLRRISSHLACCRSSQLCRLQLLSFVPQMFYQ